MLEPGALNESFSDIFGESIEFYSKNSCDWLLGGELSSASRSFSNPNAYNQPDTYKGDNWKNVTNFGCWNPGQGNDQCYVHTNSGVQNYWFYLLSVGGNGSNDNGTTYNVSGIGIDKASAIAYRNLKYYLTSGSKYENARAGSIYAAKDLFGSCSIEVAQTAKAWNAVGVYFGDYDEDKTYFNQVFDYNWDVKATNNINILGYSTVQTNSNVTFHAGNSIIMGEGFMVEEGANFYAFIDECGPSFNKYSYSNNTDNDTIVNSIKKNIYIYPNPTTNSINILIKSNEENATYVISIFNTMGKKIYQNRISTNQTTIDMSIYNPGVYFLKVQSPNNLYTEKVIVE